ncbi:hypothetical protein CSUB01_07387 [Colletotrichum sublineola]|uniref:Carboxyvinyl-carboxyphosphonate phosphorylmutase n=1 Tax=Colletotrichum sublineola TaxID=1173701 RepID=A0A066XIQ2_COLSU|nr:hypothetical protein CSUB01_07387 [Colletotrichum sublineola]
MPSSSNNTSAPVSAATKLRQRLSETDNLILLPGVYDGFSARIALEVGFDGLYMVRFPLILRPIIHLSTTSAAASPSAHRGSDPDEALWPPHGQAGRRCRDLCRAHPRRARQRMGSDIVVIARTDAIQTHGFGEAMTRLKAAVAAGADVAFLEGVTTAEEAREACETLRPTPVLLNMVEHGATPSWTAAEAKALGYRMMIVPMAAMAPAYEAIRESLAKLKDTGKVGTNSHFSPRKLFSIVGLQEAIDFDAAAGGSSYSKL